MAESFRSGELFVVDSGLFIVSTWDWYEYLHFTPVTGLATPNGPLVALHPGLNTGPVAVRTLVTDRAPLDLDTGVGDRAWEDVVEVSAHFPQAPVSVVTTSEGTVEDITAGRDSDFRLRVHALGRAEDYDEAPVKVAEHYFIHVWPAPLVPPRVLVGMDTVSGQAL